MMTTSLTNPFNADKSPLEVHVEKVKKSRRKRKIVSLTAFAVVVLLGLLCGGYCLYDSLYLKAVVPSASQKAEVNSTAPCEPFEALGFSQCSVEWVEDNTVLAGSLISQSSEAGSKVLKSEKIVLKYSTGPESVTLPTLEGLTLEDAKKTLSELGVKVNSVTYKDSSEFKAGVVISSSVASGTVVSSGSKVDLTVASGSQTVPNFVGMTQELAKTELKKGTFNVTFVEEKSDGPAGVVIKQSKEAGSSTSDPDITLTVSSAKEDYDTEIPDLYGKSKDEAQKALASLGFMRIKTVEVEAKEGSTGVLATVPSAGQKSSVSETVVVVVAKPQS